MLTKALKRFVLEEDGAMAIDWFAVTTGLLGLGAISTAAVVGTMAAGPLKQEAKPAAASASQSAGLGNWRPMALNADEIRAIAVKTSAMDVSELERMMGDLTPYARAEVTSDAQSKRLSDTYFLVRAELESRAAR